MISPQLVTCYRELKAGFDARPCDLKKCGGLLAQLKVCPKRRVRLSHVNRCCSLDSVRPGFCLCLRSQTRTWTSSFSFVRSVLLCVKLLALTIICPAGDVLEIGAILSIRGKDVPSFVRYFAQLQTFYTDYECVSAVRVVPECSNGDVDPSSLPLPERTLCWASTSFAF